MSRRPPSSLLFTTALGAVLAVGAAPAAAHQVFGVRLVDEKAERKFKKHLTRLGDALWIVCEPREGITWNPETGLIHYQGEGTNEVWVADPGRPDWVPYVLDGAERRPNGSKGVLRIPGKSIAKIDVLMPRQSLYGLSREHKIRREVIDGFRERRDAVERTARAWTVEHLRMLSHYERLASWLEQTCFAAAAEDVRAEAERERKRAKDVPEERLERALASIGLGEPPAALVAASAEVTGGEVSFGVAESQHVRVVFDRAGLSDESARALVELAERCIETFRRELVDPYVTEDFPDRVPEHRFLELWIGPSEKDRHKRFYEVYYGEEWGNDLEARLAVRGQTRRQAEPPEFLDYGKREDHFLPGVVTNRVGQVMADLHFNEGAMDMRQDWLCEAAGRWMSFEFLGRTDETTYSFAGGGAAYAGKKAAVDEGLVTILLGERHAYHALALAKGRSIDQLAPMLVYSMGDTEIAKAWSFFDWLAVEEGAAAQRFLRAGCALAREQGATFVPAWRERAAELLGLAPGDVFRELEARWRAWAERQVALDPEAER